MNSDQKLKIKQHIARWKEVGPILENLRIEELKNLDRTKEILSLSDASESALRTYPPKPTSGLIEMQRLFMKLEKWN